MEEKINVEPFEILLIEDDAADVMLMEEAFKEVKIETNIQVVNNGDDAMDLLYKRGSYADAVRPDLIMLDLNMPRKDGREVLAEIKSDPSLKKIPVIVLTTSRSREDILKSYDLHANCYINKPMGLDKFFKMVSNIEDFWFGTVKLPPRGE